MKQNKYQPPNEPGRTIQTRLHSFDETEREAIRVYDARRIRGEQARDIIASALVSYGVDNQPARIDEGTANWFLQHILRLGCNS